MASLVIIASSVAVIFMLVVLRAFTKEVKQRVPRRGGRKNDSLTMVMLERYRRRDRAA